MAKVVKFTAKDGFDFYLGPEQFTAVRIDPTDPNMVIIRDAAGVEHYVKESLDHVVNAWRD